MGVEDLVKEMLPFVAWPHPPLAFVSAEENDKRYSKFFFWRTFPSSIFTNEKKNHQRLIISPLDMEVQKFKKKFPASARMPRPLSAPLFAKIN
jgi:hypothetical protein